MQPTVIAETDDFLVLDKPAGLIVHRDGRNIEPSVAEWLGERYPALRGVGGAWVSPQGERIELNGVVHRLDRTTSGILIVAKHYAAHAAFKELFKAREIKKTYRAFVEGATDGESGVIVAEIKKTKEVPRRWYVEACAPENVRAAITEWRVLERFEGVTYLELSPKTGRTHQLRVHCASIGHPIVGDHVYGPVENAPLGFTRPALHAYTLSFHYNGTPFNFTAPLPADFETALACLLEA